MIQLITPNPDIPCRPGWCLQYVRQAFGLPARHPTATAAWEASTSKHRDRKFPKGLWLAVWFALKNEPAGHVALMAPDGSVYSTSDLGSVPHHHLDLSDLMNYYARYDMTLTYLGWTEDVAGYPVMSADTIAAQGTINPSEEDDVVTAADRAAIAKETAEMIFGWVVKEKDGNGADTGHTANLSWYLTSRAAASKEERELIADAVWGKHIIGADGNLIIPRWILESFHGILADQRRMTAEAAARLVSESTGQDPAAAYEAIAAGVERALEGVTATVTLGQEAK